MHIKQTYFFQENKAGQIIPLGKQINPCTSIRKGILPLLMILFLVFGCDSEENETPGTLPPDETNEELDTTPPTVTISNLVATVEVTTTFNVTVEDKSDVVSTKVLINGQEIYMSDQKSFSFDVDPFDYPSGENTLTLVSRDGEDNSVEQSETFELRKLLVSIAAPLVADSQQVLFSVNSLEGELLAFIETERKVENVKLYVDDSFAPQPIVVTSYILEPQSTRKATINSIANIEPGTNLIDFQVTGGVLTEHTYNGGPYGTPVTIGVSGVPTSKLANSLWTIGKDHSAKAVNIVEESEGFTAQLPFRSQKQTIDKAFIYTSNFSFLSNDQINVGDYQYVFMEDPSSSSLSYSEFKTPQSIENISIPSSVTSYALSVVGFQDAEAYSNNAYHYIYDTKFSDNLTNKIEVPVISEFGVVRNTVTMQLNNSKRYESSTLGLKNITEIPNWSAQRNGTTLSLAGEFDTFTLSILTTHDPNAGLKWSFTNEPEETFVLPFESFEFPDDFLTYATSQNLNLSSLHSNSIFFISLFDSSEELEYEELLFNIYTYNRLGDVRELSINL